MHNLSKKEKILMGGKYLFYFVGVLFLLLTPTVFIESHINICLFKNIFGVDCPGCGMTRAFSRVFRGDFAGAFYYNRLVFIVFPLLCFVCLKSLVSDYRKIRTLKSGIR